MKTKGVKIDSMQVECELKKYQKMDSDCKAVCVQPVAVTEENMLASRGEGLKCFVRTEVSLKGSARP